MGITVIHLKKIIHTKTPKYCSFQFEIIKREIERTLHNFVYKRGTCYGFRVSRKSAFTNAASFKMSRCGFKQTKFFRSFFAEEFTWIQWDKVCNRRFTEVFFSGKKNNFFHINVFLLQKTENWSNTSSGKLFKLHKNFVMFLVYLWKTMAKQNISTKQIFCLLSFEVNFSSLITVF